MADKKKSTECPRCGLIFIAGAVSKYAPTEEDLEKREAERVARANGSAKLITFEQIEALRDELDDRLFARDPSDHRYHRGA